MTTPSQPTIDTSYLEQTATALADGTVPVDHTQLAWAIGLGGQSISVQELPDWEDRGRLAVLVLAGASPAELLREVAFLVEQATSAAPAAPAQPDPFSGLLGGQQPPVPGAAPAAPAQPAPPAPPRTAKPATKAARPGGRRNA